MKEMDNFGNDDDYDFTPHRKSKNKKKPGKGKIPF